MAEKRGRAIAPGRLDAKAIAANFSDLHPPLSGHEAMVAADRCYFCHDAPCVAACPTSIDIPMFIREIAGGNTLGAARTIFTQNILGGMCARVCPTETLCEEACVRETAEGKPVRIGLLQRHATDAAMAAGTQFFGRARATGRKIAVIGAGPAGLACAHRLAMRGHAVTIFEEKKKPGGLNEFGIAAYKTIDGFAQREVGYVTAIGGIDIEYGQSLGRKLRLDKLAESHDAVFIGAGLGSVNALGLKGKDPEGVEDAVGFIAQIRQAKNLAKVPVGRRVVVIGGGMTAIDAAVQAKLLGAAEVTLCYRRGPAQMGASRFEQELAASRGVVIRHWLAPKRLKAAKGRLSAVVLEETALKKGKLAKTGRTVTIECDQLFRAIGQTLKDRDFPAALKRDKGRIATDAEGRTSMKGVWAGGDCTNRGEDLTVTAVAQGRDAAESIDRELAR